ncbi:MAG: hypothetical protein WCV58_03735 [Patescibacteria group bacterium]
MSQVVVEESGKEMRLWKQAVSEIQERASEILGERLAVLSGEGDDLSTIWWSISIVRPYVALRFGRWEWWKNDYVHVATIERNHSEVHLREPKLETMIKEVLSRLGRELNQSRMMITTDYN